MAPKKVKSFDVAKLQAMLSPLTVTVDKRKGNGKQPVNLPGKDGGPPGTGWEEADVLDLTNLVRAIPGGGGGMYVATCTDSNGVSMEWEFGWDPKQFPEIAPDGSMPAPTPAVPSQQQGNSWIFGAAQPHPWASVNGFGAAPAAPPARPQMPYGYQPQQPQVPFGYRPSHQPSPYGYPQPPSDRMRQLEEQLRRTEHENQQKDYEARLSAQAAESTRNMDALKEELRRLAENKNTGESETVRLLREQVSELKQLMLAGQNKGEPDYVRTIREEMARDRQQAERDRVEARALAERSQQEARHQAELLKIQAASNKGPDPMIEMFRENARAAAETQRETSRLQRESTDRMTSFMISPGHLAEIMNKQSSNGSMRDNFELFRSVLEMGGQGPSPGVALAGEGLARASEIAGAWVNAQRDAAVAQAQSQAQAASAHAHAEAEAARVHNHPQGIPTAEQLGGAEGEGGEEQQDADVINLDERRQKPPTDEEMFGDAWPSVQRMREGVANGKLDPQETVNAILQGIAYCHENEIIIPAFTLFAEGQFADLMDALLPGVPGDFLASCVQLLVQVSRGSMPQVEPVEPPPPPSPA